MELYKANRQWSERPADERFPDLQSLYNATRKYADTAKVIDRPYADLRVEAQGEDVNLVGRGGIPATFTHWSFGQLSARAGAPVDYLRSLPPTLAAQNLNYGLCNRPPGGNAQLLFHNGDHLMLRAFTSDKYSRIWNYEVASRCQELADRYTLTPARPTFRQSDDDFPALYASDHDMFAFLTSSNAVTEYGTNSPLRRGVIVENSEVGASALKLTRFLYREMCGNHIIWGASDVVDISVRHVGEVRDKLRQWNISINRYLNSSVSDEEAVITRSRSKMIGGTKEEVLDRLFGLRSLRLSRKVIDAGYDAVKPDSDGSPNSVWGMVQGLTRASQETTYADRRIETDAAAGRLLEMVDRF